MGIVAISVMRPGPLNKFSIYHCQAAVNEIRLKLAQQFQSRSHLKKLTKPTPDHDLHVYYKLLWLWWTNKDQDGPVLLPWGTREIIWIKETDTQKFSIFLCWWLITSAFNSSWKINFSILFPCKYIGRAFHRPRIIIATNLISLP